MGRSQDVWVDQTPKYMAIGEAMSFTMDFADVGTPTSPTVTAYNAAGTDVSSTMLSGSASVSGTIVTLKKFTPSSVQTYRLTVSVTVSGNTVIGALDVVVVSLTPTANIINGYTTRNAVLDLLRVTSTDAPDDSVIDALIAQASRYIDQKTGRTFYPRVETRLYDVPSPMSRELWINDDDLLAVVTLTNGDTTVLTTTDYFLLPRNDYPKYAIAIKESSSVIWETDSNNDSEGAISLAAIYGFRQQYGTRGFVTGANLNEASGLNAADTTFTMVSEACGAMIRRFPGSSRASRPVPWRSPGAGRRIGRRGSPRSISRRSPGSGCAGPSRRENPSSFSRPPGHDTGPRHESR